MKPSATGYESKCSARWYQEVTGRSRNLLGFFKSRSERIWPESFQFPRNVMKNVIGHARLDTFNM